jgi:hypothetical protein
VSGLQGWAAQEKRIRKLLGLALDDPDYYSMAFPFLEWGKMLDRDGYKCAICGKEGKITIDHIVPISKGGTNAIENLQPLCRHCNASKGNTMKTNKQQKTAAAAVLGKVGGKSKSEIKQTAARENGKKGGRPTGKTKEGMERCAHSKRQLDRALASCPAWMQEIPWPRLVGRKTLWKIAAFDRKDVEQGMLDDTIWPSISVVSPNRKRDLAIALGLRWEVTMTPLPPCATCGAKRKGAIHDVRVIR